MLRSLQSRLVLAAVLGLGALLFAPAANGQYYNYFGKNKVRYEEFKWQIYHGTHFDVYYYPESEKNLRKVLSLAESAYDRLSQELDFQIQEPTPLIIYSTHSDFLQNNIILNFIPEGVAAFATPARFRMVLPIDLPDPELYELILHELTHIFQYHILFSGSLGKALTSSPPTWLMEGMASYFAKDESTSDKMFLRDAVVNDSIPPITQSNVTGFFAYRFGHAAFDFMEERWGRDGVMDFLFEFRNTIGGRVGRAVERAFRMDPEDFDLEFRRWLRARYLPELVATGEPSDFGRPFRTEGGGSQETSPVASPSGDLVASFSTHKRDLDIVLFDAERRRLLRNLTKGYSIKYQHLVAQHLTIARKQGRDIAFSPDGNTLAAFVRKESGYSLGLFDVLQGGVDRIIDMDVEQQTSPAWSPDGRSIAFAGNREGNFDLFLLDLDTLQIRNLTNDDIYDGAPTFSPDGGSIVFVSVISEYSQIFRLDLESGERFRITDAGNLAEVNNTDPVFSPDGGRVYFTSDQTGAENIFGIDLASGEIRQYTNAVTGCFQPTVLEQPGGEERLVYTGYWKGRFDLYQTDIEEPIGEVQVVQLEERPLPSEELERFEPDIQVSLDESNLEEKKGFKLFLEDAGAFVGLDDDQTFIGNVVLTFSDFLGDRRLIAAFQSIESFSNFNVFYTDLSKRRQWSVHLFDDRDFFIGRDFRDGSIDRGRTAFRQTGAIASISYPFSFYRRAEVGVGYIVRDIDFQSFAPIDPDNVLDPNDVIIGPGGQPFVPIIEPRKDDFPQLSASLTGDTAVFGPAGPARGSRWRIWGTYAPDLDESGTLTASLRLDARKYFAITRRSSLAMRLFAGGSDGNFPEPLYIGGLDTVRGFEFRELVGDRAFFANIELRFPLIDFFVTPVISFQGIQGRFFLDVAGAWFDEFEDWDFWDSQESRLDDAVSSYGFGFTVRLFGLDLNWDFAKQWDFDRSISDSFTTSFWIGQRF